VLAQRRRAVCQRSPAVPCRRSRAVPCWRSAAVACLLRPRRTRPCPTHPAWPHVPVLVYSCPGVWSV